MIKIPKNEHSILPPSKMDFFLRCPYAAVLYPKFSQIVTRKMAEGTVCHYIASQLLFEYNSELFNETYEVDGYLITPNDEMIASIKYYVDYIEGLIPLAGICSLESKYSLNIGNGEIFGYADCIVRRNRNITVIDYKAGDMPVYAKNNKQLMTYMLGVMNRIGPESLAKVFSFTGIIVQPSIKDHPIDICEYTIYELSEFRTKIEQLYEKVKNPKKIIRDPDCKECSQCNMCTICDLFLGHLTSEFTGALDFADDEFMALVVKNAKLLRKYIDACEQNITSKCIGGSKFDGLKLVNKNTKRRWIDDDEKIRNTLEKYGFTIDDLMEMKLIGLAKAKDRLQGQVYNEIINEITVKPTGELEIAPDWDKRIGVDEL